MSVRFVVAAVAAAVVGYVTESPQAGMATFSAVYGVTGFLDPNQKVMGPRLNDLKFPAASYGSPEPYVEGHPRIPGVVIWSIDPKREVANQATQSSKGGPSVDSTTFTYEVDMRILLSENVGFRPRKCFSNGALIWSAADDADHETLTASAETVSWRELRIYTGEDDQMPDPTEEAYVGTGLSPGYVGRSTIVIVGLNCGQSGQLPVLTWEISNGTQTETVALTKLRANIDNTSGMDDTSAYAATPVFFGTDYEVDALSGRFRVQETNTTTGVSWTGPQLALDPSLGFTLQTKGSWDSGVGDNAFIARWVSGGTFLLSIDAVAVFPFDQWRVRISGTDLGSPTQVGPLFSPGEPAHIDIVRPPGVAQTATVYVNGISVLTFTQSATATGDGTVYIEKIAAGGATAHTTYFVGLTAAPLTALAPDELPPADAATLVLALAEPTRADCLQRQMTRAGLDPALLDVSLVTGNVRAMAVSQLTSPRAVMENIATMFPPLEFVETGDGIKVVPRGGAVVKTIPYEDMGAFTGDQAGEPMPRTRGNELEVAEQVSIKYMNVDDDYRDGTETSTRLATGSSIVTVAEVPLGLTATEAKRLADFAVSDALASLIRIGPITFTRKHADLECGDVVALTGKDGSTKRTRIKKRTESPGGLITIEGVEDDASVVDSAAVTSSNYTSSSAVRSFSPVDATFIDGPILHESDNSRGIYVAAKPTGTKFSSYAVLKSPDDVDFTVLGVGYKAAVKGTCSVVPGDWTGGRVFDESDSIVCDLGAGTAAGTTRAAILADKSVNSAFIGADGRWMFLQFRDAEMLSAGVFKLTGLLLGDRGTEHNIGTQVVGDEIILLASGGINRIGEDATDLGTLRHYKAVSNGRTVTGTASQPFTENEVGLKPFAPVYLRADRAGGDITLRWTRRTRLATITAGPMAPIVPLGEESESYSVDIYSDDTYATVVRTLPTVFAPTATYSAADQVADFGSAQATIYAKVYQLSGLVGRGIPLEAAA